MLIRGAAARRRTERAVDDMARRRSRRGGGILTLAAFGLICALAGAVVVLLLARAPQSADTEDAPRATETPAPTISDLAARWAGSVAEIEVEYQAGRRLQRVDQGNGSGVYIDERGFFLTNYHVVEDALNLIVRLADGREMPVRQSAHDSTYDLAVLYTGPAEGVPAVRMGASSALRIGDPVFAVGYPRVGDDVLSGTLTMGVVSGLNRLNLTAGNISPKVGMIQLDAAINAGNSGGALFDMNGDLVGIPTMKIASGYGDESFEGLAFAIPTDVAAPVAARLIDGLLAGDGG